MFTTALQVVDARDPLTYFSRDLVACANELHPTKSSFILLNKADLLPEAVRTAWADFFDAQGLQYGFWSAFVASEAQAKARHDALALGLAAPDPAAVARYFRQLLGLPAAADAEDGSSSSNSSSRTRILSVDEMLVVLEGLARQAVDAADEDDPRRWVHVGGVCVCGIGDCGCACKLLAAPLCSPASSAAHSYQGMLMCCNMVKV
jgi:large subunit GTPase 1